MSYVSNDLFFKFLIVVARMDPNADQMLRKNGATWRGGYQIYYSLGHTLDAIVETITQSNGTLYDISLYRER